MFRGFPIIEVYSCQATFLAKILLLLFTDIPSYLAPINEITTGRLRSSSCDLAEARSGPISVARTRRTDPRDFYFSPMRIESVCKALKEPSVRVEPKGTNIPGALMTTRLI